MAEILVYNRDHWSVGVSAIIKSNWDATVIKKMTHAYEKGDPVEIRPDGYWSKEHGWRKDCFALLKLPGVPVDSVRHYADVQADIEGNLIKKRRYSLKILNFALEKEQTKASVSVYDKATTAVIIG